MRPSARACSFSFTPREDRSRCPPDWNLLAERWAVLESRLHHPLYEPKPHGGCLRATLSRHQLLVSEFDLESAVAIAKNRGLPANGSNGVLDPEPKDVRPLDRLPEIEPSGADFALVYKGRGLLQFLGQIALCQTSRNPSLPQHCGIVASPDVRRIPYQHGGLVEPDALLGELNQEL
jgi:hypothetical protein